MSQSERSKTRSRLETPSPSPTFGERLKAAQDVWPHLKPPWHPHLPDKEHGIAEALSPGPGIMSPEEDYGFDVKGYLRLRGVLSDDEVAACNEIIDDGGVPTGLCQHPATVAYVEQLCGLAYRVDDPVVMVDAPNQAGQAVMSGGDEPRNPSRGYFRQGSSRFCQGVRAVWVLKDKGPGSSGIRLLPASHNLQVPVPPEVVEGKNDYLESLGMCLEPELKAGDLLLFASTLAHGFFSVSDASEACRMATCEFVSVNARPSDFPSDSLSAGRADSDMTWVKNLTHEQRTVLGLEDTEKGPAPPLISDGKRNKIGDANRSNRGLYHPGVYETRPTDLSEVDPLEFFFWELTGFLVIRGVMDGDWIDEANAAFERNRDKIDYEGASKIQQGGGEKMRGTGRPGLGISTLSEEDREPFFRMMAHPALVHRLNWMLGGHFRCEGPGAVLATQNGGGGQILHGNGEPIYANLNWWPYLYRNGRCYTGQVNVAWQLHDVTEEEGGFVVVPGSHHGRFPLPSNDPTDIADHKGVLHPLMKAGDLLFFMGGATCHGAISWNSHIERRCVLNGYWSKDMARFAWVNNLA